MATVWEALTQLESIAWIMLMVIVVVICATVKSLTKARMRHQERMAMIQKGMNPGPPEKDDEDDD